MMKDVAWIRNTGAKVNNSCGLHVHVGFDKEDEAAVDRLVALVAHFERALFASTGTRNREEGNNPSGRIWCKGLQQYGTIPAAKNSARNDRYHMLNLATGRKPTVEFRMFSGTLNPVKIAGHVGTCIALVQRASKSKKVVPFFSPPLSPTHPAARKGDGLSALERLFIQSGWTRYGRKTKYAAELFQIDGVPSLERVKSTLKKMAQKYDGTIAEEDDDEVVEAPIRGTRNPPTPVARSSRSLVAQAPIDFEPGADTMAWIEAVAPANGVEEVANVTSEIPRSMLARENAGVSGNRRPLLPTAGSCTVSGRVTYSVDGRTIVDREVNSLAELEAAMVENHDVTVVEREDATTSAAGFPTSRAGRSHVTRATQTAHLDNVPTFAYAVTSCRCDICQAIRLVYPNRRERMNEPLIPQVRYHEWQDRAASFRNMADYLPAQAQPIEGCTCDECEAIREYRPERRERSRDEERRRIISDMPF